MQSSHKWILQSRSQFGRKKVSKQIVTLPNGAATEPIPIRALHIANTDRPIVTAKRPRLHTWPVRLSMGDSHDLHGQSGAKSEQWKFEAPYRIHESSETFDVKYTASCHCGKVQYQLKREAPLDSKFCHCVDCQVQHGMYSSMLDKSCHCG